MMGAPFRSILFLLPLAAFAAARPEQLGFDLSATNAPDYVASIYIAPENEFLYRMRFPDGHYREFQKTELDSSNPLQALWSPGNWQGALKGKVHQIAVESSTNVVGGRAGFLFKNGRIIRFEQGDKLWSFPYEIPRPPTAGGAPDYFGTLATSKAGGLAGRLGASRVAKDTAVKDVERELKKKWANTGRLRWPFDNPNENGFLFAALALLSTALFYVHIWFGRFVLRLRFKQKIFKYRSAYVSIVPIIGGVCFAVAIALVMMTVSRGSILALISGLLPACILNFKKLIRSKGVRVLAGIMLLTAAVWVALHSSSFARGFVKKSRWSNDTRVEMLLTAPQMIAEAPNGWGDMHVGRVHVDWYGDLSTITLSGSLMSDHFTRLVEYGRIGRFTYLFVWLVLLSLMTYTAVRTKRAIALGVFVALAVAGCFNAVLMNVYLWSMPAIALALFVAERPWRVWRVRTVSLIVGGAIVLAGGTLAGIEAYGRAKLKRLHPIFVEDGRVCVKDDSPNIWIVDDSKALGGVLSPCRDIRRHFLRHPSTPSVGYVRNVEKLPRKRVDRLVLAGKAGQDWLDWIYKCAEKGEEVSQFFPKELVFISPIFLPSALPEGIEEACKVKYVIGEFVARYHPDEFERPPEWVKVVPGMELYIQNWMRFAVE